jgi:hypothetical protein
MSERESIGPERGPGPETHDEEDLLERAFTHDFYEVPEPAVDDHLESDYEERVSGYGDDY